MTAKRRSKYTDYTFITTGFILLFILVVRVTRGLDLTDEMQYYGEIKGLIETGRLFSNDLFIQQTVYILLYPFFYLYNMLFGYAGLVFFGRVIMSVLSIIVFLYAYRKLLEFKFTPFTACLTALSLTFAIPYHGIFAPSYNTVSQILWIIFMLRFFEWKRSSAISWGALPITMAFAHPTSAVTMSLLILVRFLAEREYRRFAGLLLVFFGGALTVASVMFYFGTVQDYLASLAFSSGYGVGTIFFSDKSNQTTLLVIYGVFGFFLFFGRFFNRTGYAVVTGLCIAGSTVLFFTGFTGGAYTVSVVYILSSLSALAYGWGLAASPVSEKTIRRRIHWLMTGLLTYATTLGVTSGNGIGQTTGAFIVGFTFFLGIAVNSVAREETPDWLAVLKYTSVALALILLVTNWCFYPYREYAFWNASQEIQQVPEFRFISTSQERAAFIRRMQSELKSLTYGRRVLIVSEYPGLYFALGAHPETSMLYMHSLTSDKSQAALLNSLSKKNPEIVVDIYANNDMSKENSRIKYVMYNYYSQSGFNCMAESVELNSVSKNNPKQLKYLVCM